MAAHGESTAECHIILGDHHCAGLAIYRANVFKLLRDPKGFRLPANREAVFDRPEQFLEHHHGIPLDP